MNLHDKVEVHSSEEGFSDAWATAIVVGEDNKGKGQWLVEYTKFVNADGSALREKVMPDRLRHVPQFPITFNPGPGLRIEGYLHDCWWPGEVVEQHPRKGFRVCFDDGDYAWLVRRNVRPLLRRAPQEGEAWKPSSAIGGGEPPSVDPASTPPMAPMPLRFPLELNPHVVMSAIDALVKGRDWSTLRVSSVERELEARLLPERPPGWMRPRRRALLAAIERALASGLKAQPMKRPASHRPVASSAGRQNGKRLKKDADGDGTARPSLAATADAAVHPSSNPIGIQPAPAGRLDRWDSQSVELG